jgi:hypothetical protein
MSRDITHGSTDQSTVIRILNTSGIPQTDVTSATTGLVINYRRTGGLVVPISLSDLSAADDAHTDGGFIHLSDGLYRVDLPDAACASGATSVTITGTATSRVIIPATHALVATNNQDAVRGGMTALPNANAAANGGLPTVDANNRIAGIQGTKNTLDNLNDIAATDIVSGGAITTSGGVANANTVLIEGTDATDTLDARIAAQIVVYGLDHLVQASVTGTDVADNSIIARLVSKSATADWDSFVHTTDSLQALADSASTFNPATDMVDGVTYASLFETLLAYIAAPSSTLTDNEDGTLTIVYPKQDDSTPKLSITFDELTGEWTDTTIG